MLTFLICLLPVVATLSEPILLENYIVNIRDDTLKNVRFIGDSDPVLNLSSRNLQMIEKDALNNVSDVISLDLSNNLLTSLPEFIFSNLTKLESLSLANNRLSKLQHLFIGLENMQVLDISRNPIHHLRRGSLFGLPKFARILTDENNFLSISTDMFRNYSIGKEELVRIRAQAKTESKGMYEILMNDLRADDVAFVIDFHKDIRLELCKSDGIVTRLYILWKIEEFDEGCVPINASSKQIYLHAQNITGFREDWWYKLYILPIESLDLSNNRITEIMKEMLNNLPASVRQVNFRNNQIHKVHSQVIENYHLRTLYIQSNMVYEIEDNAFAKTRLHDLHLSENQLNSLDFVSTLPYTMTRLIVSKNLIISIPNNIFFRLPNLSYLNLWQNRIETLENNIFQYLTSLNTLVLATNNITTIKPAAFKGLTALKKLYLQYNNIRDLRANTFTELTALKVLDLSYNKIIKISFIDLPLTLNDLYIDFNEISVLEKSSFVNVPNFNLSLLGNKISSIARGAFNLPTLKELNLDNNNLTTIDGDSYEGLDSLEILDLSRNQISEIRKGSCKHLRNLYSLHLSYNLFQKLEAGAFYGLNTDAERNVHIQGNNLKEMQAGLFDEI